MDWLRVEICSAHTFPLNRLAGRQGAIEGRKYVHIWTGAQHTRRRGRHNLIIRLGPKSMDGSRYFTLAASERAGEHANPSLKAWAEFISHSLTLSALYSPISCHALINSRRTGSAVMLHARHADAGLNFPAPIFVPFSTDCYFFGSQSRIQTLLFVTPGCISFLLFWVK